jgi:tetratricopeptide (TPR) repeat protein
VGLSGLRFLAITTLAGILSCVSLPVRAETLSVPPETAAIVEKIYQFDVEGAVADSRKMQAAKPEYPLGYLLEAEALWWKIWCSSLEYKYGMVDARHRAKLEGDQNYLDLIAKISTMAEKQIQTKDSAEMQFYAGMSGALAARFYALRGENRNAARAGVKARERLLRALSLDKDLADADLGLGLYNYYVDTLSSIARMLRFLMGIPGGSKQEGIRLLENDMASGVITADAARLYLALNLHRYDQQYERALEVITPLVEKFPRNPLFQMAKGDLYGKLGRKEQALAAYKIAGVLPIADAECRNKMQELVRLASAAQGGGDPKAIQ